MRARAELKKAPAEPITARIAVGFSGEWSQPSCACSGRAVESRRARPRSMRVDLFIEGSPLGKVVAQKIDLSSLKKHVAIISVLHLLRDGALHIKR